VLEIFFEYSTLSSSLSLTVLTGYEVPLNNLRHIVEYPLVMSSEGMKQGRTNSTGYSFELPDWSIPSKRGAPYVLFVEGLVEAGLTREKVLGFTAFQNWIRTLESSLQRHKFTNSRIYG
jgi:hypothetical protein